MFDWFRKMCGEGNIRFEVILKDGRDFTVKMPFIGSIENEKNLINNILPVIEVELGQVKKIRIIAISGYSSCDGEITGEWFVRPDFALKNDMRQKVTKQ